MVGLFLAAWEAGPDSPERARFEDGVEALRRIDPANPWDDHLEAMFAFREGRAEEAIDRLTAILSRDDLAPAAAGEVSGLLRLVPFPDPLRGGVVVAIS